MNRLSNDVKELIPINYCSDGDLEVDIADIPNLIKKNEAM